MTGGQLAEMTNGKNYRETRTYESGHTVVKFYFVTRCFSEHVQSLLDEMKEFQPHVIIMNSCLWDLHRYGPHGLAAFKVNLGKLVFALNSTLKSDSVFIWNATLPLASKCKGGFLLPLFDTIPSREIVEANFFARNLMSSSKRVFLDLHGIFSLQLHHRAHDGVHWDKIAHRRITNLILTELSHLWNISLPRRSLLDPIPWNNVFQSATSPFSGFSSGDGLLPTPSSLNSPTINSYRSLMDLCFGPTVADRPLSTSFCGGTGILDKFIFNSGALSDGNDYEDVDTAREYKQRFRFSSTSCNPAKKSEDDAQIGNKGMKKENPKLELNRQNSKNCVKEDTKQLSCKTTLDGHQARPVKLSSDQTDVELIKKEFLEPDQELGKAYRSRNEIKSLPRSSSFTCARMKTSVPVDIPNSSSKTSFGHCNSPNVDAEKNHVETDLSMFDNQQMSLPEEPFGRSTPCSRGQLESAATFGENGADNLSNSEEIFEKSTNVSLSACAERINLFVNSPKPPVHQVEEEKSNTNSFALCFGVQDLCQQQKCASGNKMVQLESGNAACNSILINEEKELNVNDISSMKAEKTVDDKAVVPLEKTPKSRVVDNEVQRCQTGDRKRKLHVASEKLYHKKMKTDNGAKCPVGQLRDTEENLTVSSKDVNCVQIKKKEKHRHTSSLLVTDKLPCKAKKRHEEKHHHRHHKSKHASRKRHVGLEEQGCSSSSSCKTESKVSVSAYVNKSSTSSNISLNQEELMSKCLKIAADNSVKTPNEHLKNRCVPKRETSNNITSAGSKCLDVHPVPVVESNRQENLVFRQPTNPPPRKAVQSKVLSTYGYNSYQVQPTYRYNPYQYQNQQSRQQYLQPVRQESQQANFCSWTRTPQSYQQQYSSSNQQGTGNVYINVNHPAMRQTITEWQRLMSFYANGKY